MKKQILTLIAAASFSAALPSANAHCQIPCGIYNDSVRVVLMEEHLATIKKSMQQIDSLSSAEKPDANQLNRWVMNKEKHAEELDQIITYYFMTQRIKPVAKDDQKYDQYVANCTTLHQMLVLSMKCKQTTDTTLVDQIQELIHSFEHTYPGLEHDH
jgi:nickel superoxide dismutase